MRLRSATWFLLALAAACGGNRAVKPAATQPVAAAQPPPTPPKAVPQPAPPRGEHIEVPVNDMVLAQLHKLTATPGARHHIRGALAHRQRFVRSVDAALAAEHVPLQLDAIPLIETGYENLDGGKNGKGLWQFIKATAVHYGLRVEGEIDERMNPARETAAAARYLSDLHRELKDWPLTLAAYAQGITFVRGVMRREHTRDVWALIRRGALGPYAARVMAAALIIHDPSSAEGKEPSA